MIDAFSHALENDSELLIPILMFGIGGIIAVVAIVFGSIKSMEISKTQERTKREIAAYIAEGAMTPEDGERLLAAGQPQGKKKSHCCL